MAQVYQSSIGKELAKYQKDVQYWIRGRLLDTGKRWRKRLIRERLSGPPGVFRKTGRLVKSVRYKTKANQDGTVKIDMWLDTNIAPYAADLERRNLIGFKRIAAEEQNKAVKEIRAGIQQFGKGKFGKKINLDSLVPEESSVPDTLSAEAASTKERFNAFTSKGRRNLKTQSKHLRKESRKRKNRSIRAELENKAKRIDDTVERARLRSRRQRTRVKVKL